MMLSAKDVQFGTFVTAPDLLIGSKQSAFAEGIDSLGVGDSRESVMQWYTYFQSIKQ